MYLNFKFLKDPEILSESYIKQVYITESDIIFTSGQTCCPQNECVAMSKEKFIDWYTSELKKLKCENGRDVEMFDEYLQVLDRLKKAVLKTSSFEINEDELSKIIKEFEYSRWFRIKYNSSQQQLVIGTCVFSPKNNPLMDQITENINWFNKRKKDRMRDIAKINYHLAYCE